MRLSGANSWFRSARPTGFGSQLPLRAEPGARGGALLRKLLNLGLRWVARGKRGVDPRRWTEHGFGEKVHTLKGEYIWDLSPTRVRSVLSLKDPFAGTHLDFSRSGTNPRRRIPRNGEEVRYVEHWNHALHVRSLPLRRG